jgi:hypothetical protein
MFPRNPTVLIDNKVLVATEVHAMVVDTKLEHLDSAEVIVGSPAQSPLPMYRLGASLQIKLALGDSIFAGRIAGIAPHAGLRQWVIRALGPMRLPQPVRASDVRIAPPIRSMAVSISPVYLGNKHQGRATLTLDPEVESVKFVLGDTKHVAAGPGRSFTGSIENIERRYGQFGGDQMRLDVVGWMPESLTPGYPARAD